MFRLFPLAPFDAASESQFQHLRGSRVRVGTLDLKNRGRRLDERPDSADA